MRETRRLPATRRAPQRATVVRITPSSGRPGSDGALALARSAADAPRQRRKPHLTVVGASPPRRTAEATLRLIIEVLAGTRPPRQLSARAVQDVWHGLAVHQAPSTRRLVTPPRILRTWLQDPSPGALESGAVFLLDGRVHALAVRLEHRRGDWRCTALETTVPPRRGPR